MPTVKAQFVQTLFRTQVVQSIRDWALWRPLLLKASGHRVPFSSFAEASAARAPKPIGYETCPGDLYLSLKNELIPGDHASMFWLGQALRDNFNVFDFGGNIGLQYYSFGQRMHFPSTLQWTVCEISPFVETGRKIAAEHRAENLKFTYEFREAASADLLLVSGCLHYLEEPFSQRLASLPRRPEKLLINRVPLTDGPTTVTLQDIGKALLPVIIRNRDEFLRDIQQAGYHCIDKWQVRELECTMPFYPERSAHHYTGFYFEAGP